ncbi:auxin response factor [Musa troglodytarum]|uniref:Auxin response factor n=1 Tax=Musa troglodytarum TaxID=320322 RepID=A0A9E7GQZ1_9LILI|nr:auxin response factor [Musa troglodytarum]
MPEGPPKGRTGGSPLFGRRIRPTHGGEGKAGAFGTLEFVSWPRGSESRLSDMLKKGDTLYEQLWRACAGPLVEIPRVDERVFYFPQGHLEQLEVSTDQELNQQIPLFNLPSKILCRVVNVTLKDVSQQTPSQELVAKDLHGLEWRFKHIFRGQPRRHLLTTGWSTFVASKRLVAGDAFILMRGENDELRVGVRRLVRCQNTLPTSVISSHSMHVGVLATASHAISTHTLFMVYYKPRCNQFIVSLNKYLEATKNEFAVGMRFKMRFEGEDVPEKSFTGTVIGIGDISSQWPGSKWRSLKVHWDEASSIQKPENISPWDVEPSSQPVSTSGDPQAAFSKKRARSPVDLPGTEPSSNFRHPVKDQMFDLGPPNSISARSLETRFLWSPRQTESINFNYLNIPRPCNRGLLDGWLKDSHSPLNGTSSSLPHVTPKRLEDAVDDAEVTLPSWRLASTPITKEPSLDLECKIENEKKPKSSGCYRLFGIDLVSPSAGISSTVLSGDHMCI